MPTLHSSTSHFLLKVSDSCTTPLSNFPKLSVGLSHLFLVGIGILALNSFLVVLFLLFKLQNNFFSTLLPIKYFLL